MRQEAIYRTRRRTAAGVAIGLSVLGIAAYDFSHSGDTRPGCEMSAQTGQGVDGLSYTLNEAGGDVSGDAIVISGIGTRQLASREGFNQYDDSGGLMDIGDRAEF